jgi:hypothetical protein
VYSFPSIVKIKLLYADAFFLSDLRENSMGIQRVKKNKEKQNCFMRIFLLQFSAYL